MSVSHDDGTPGHWRVDGTITVTNPDASDVTLSGIGDAVDNGGHCTVDTSQGLTVQPGDTKYPYWCDYAAAPSPAAGTNTVTVEWDDQALSDGSVLAAGHASWARGGRLRERRPDDRRRERRRDRQPRRGSRDRLVHRSAHDSDLVPVLLPRRPGRKRHGARQHGHVHDRHDRDDRIRDHDGHRLRRRRPDRFEDREHVIRARVLLDDLEGGRQDRCPAVRRDGDVQLHRQRCGDRLLGLRLDGRRNDHRDQPERLGGRGREPVRLASGLHVCSADRDGSGRRFGPRALLVPALERCERHEHRHRNLEHVGVLHAERLRVGQRRVRLRISVEHRRTEPSASRIRTRARSAR